MNYDMLDTDDDFTEAGPVDDFVRRADALERAHNRLTDLSADIKRLPANERRLILREMRKLFEDVQ